MLYFIACCSFSVIFSLRATMLINLNLNLNLNLVTSQVPQAPVKGFWCTFKLSTLHRYFAQLYYDLLKFSG